MKQEDTRQKILAKALELFSVHGYDAVSVGQIAAAVGIKAPSLYNHFPSKRAIFDAIVEATAAQYEADTDRIDIHVQNARQDIPVFTRITEDGLLEKVRQIFFYSLHNETISRFRRMMTLEQFRSPELAALYSRRYVERVTEYHAGIFRSLIAAGELRDEDAGAMALCYVPPSSPSSASVTASPSAKLRACRSSRRTSACSTGPFRQTGTKGARTMSREEQWLLCPVCGAKTRLRLLQRTVLREFPLYCPKCRRESVISARNFQIETVYQPDAKTQC